MEAHAEINWLLMAFKILSVFFLVGMNGFFVAAEFALVKIRGTQLQPLVAKDHRRAKIAHSIIDNLDAFLSACQLGITLASLALGWIGEPIFETLLEPVFIGWISIRTGKSSRSDSVSLLLQYYILSSAKLPPSRWLFRNHSQPVYGLPIR